AGLPTPRTPKSRTPGPSRSSRRTTRSETCCGCNYLPTSRFDSPATCSLIRWRTRSISRSKRTATTLRWMRYRRRLRICHRRWKGCGKSSKSRLRLPSTPRSRSSSGHSLCIVG
ncbi:unnamed protein product, partial [Ectocarpus fasciculatus]